MAVVFKVFRRTFCTPAFSSAELDSLRKITKQVRCEVNLPEQAQKRTVAILVGWAASKLRHIGKYAPLYADLGIPCLCVAPHMFHVWIKSSSDSLTQSILTGVEASFATPVSLVFHLFSGAANVILPKVCEEYLKSGSKLADKLPIAGVVFDSGPVDFAYETGTAAAKLVYEQGRYNLPTYMAATSFGVATDWMFGSKKRQDLNTALKTTVLKVPQLYLYSEADTVMLPSRARQRIEAQVAMGRDVTSHCWKDSQHVRHFTDHPVEYQTQLATFLKKVT